jgi:C-terminal processing protease CtpA/Prc
LVDRAENKLVIEKIIDTALANTLEPGDIITSVDGIIAKEFVNNTEKYISGSSQWKRSRSKTELFSGTENSTVQLVVDRKGKILKHELKRNIRTSSLYSAMTERQKSGFIKPGVYYIDLDKQPFDSIKNRLADLKMAKAIICDLRGYPNNNHQFISYLLKEKENTKWMFIPEIIYPDYEKVNYAGLGWSMAPASESLNARVIFLTDGRAISYAESYMGFIKDFRLATIVGQPTAGTNGNINPFSLPGGYNISWTGMLVKNHDGSRHHLRGIVPDVYVERTVKGIAEGRDEFLEKAVELAEK